jgi:hypothetical protein
MYFVKSFPDDFKGLERVVEGARVLHQTTQSVLDTLMLDTNTVSFGRGPRLSTTFLDTNYMTTYRRQGIIFTLPPWAQQDYIFPFDLNVLSQQENPEVEYAKMREELHKHYWPEMIPWFVQFQSTTYQEMKEKFGDTQWIISPAHVMELVNAFRVKQWWPALTFETHSKLFLYNEAVFCSPIKMIPQAIFGETQEAKYRAKTYHLPLYHSAADFYLEHLEEMITVAPK